jgi:hypothetical protein
MPRSEACQETLAEIRTAPLSIALREAEESSRHRRMTARHCQYEGGLVASPRVDFRRSSGWKGSGSWEGAGDGTRIRLLWLRLITPRYKSLLFKEE